MRGSSSSRVWAIAFIITISLVRIGMGIYNSLYGPALLYLADNVGVTVSKVSTVFSGRSLGILLGAILGGVMKNITGPSFRHLFVLGLGIGILGLAELVTPWIKEFWVLIVDITIGGIMFGFLDSGLQALILQLWGEEASRSLIQVFHLMYSVGALIAPLIARPFLEISNEETGADENCPNTDPELITVTRSTLNQTSTTDPFTNSFDPVGWVFVISAAWLGFVSLLIVLLASFNVEARVSSGVQKRGYSTEDRPEEPIRDVIWFFLLVIGYYFCSVTTENVFYNYIYSVSLCSGLNFTVAQASQITSVFWLGLGVGRLSGVVAAAYFKPKTIIIASIVGSILDSLFMSLFGEKTAWLAWLFSGLHGVSTALLYPSGISWVSQITNISGTYMFICNIGNAVGSLTMLPLAGYLFDWNPFSVMYLVFVLASLNAGFFALAYLAGRQHKTYLQKALLQASLSQSEGSIDLTSKNREIEIETKGSYLRSTKL